MILKNVNKGNADKFQELRSLEKTANQSYVWQTFTIMALDRLRNKGSLEEKKTQSQSGPDNYQKAEAAFLANMEWMTIEAAKDGMIDLLIMYLKTDETFSHVPYWEKRAQFITVSKFKSILDV